MKNIIKYLKASTLLTAFCGLFSLGCLTLDHAQKKVERVSADYTYVSDMDVNLGGDNQYSYYEIKGKATDIYNYIDIGDYSGAFNFDFKLRYDSGTNYRFTLVFELERLWYGGVMSNNLYLISRDFDLNTHNSNLNQRELNLSSGSISSINITLKSISTYLDSTVSGYDIEYVFHVSIYRTGSGSTTLFDSDITQYARLRSPLPSSTDLSSSNFVPNLLIQIPVSSMVTDFKDSVVSSYSSGYSSGLDSTQEEVYQQGYDEGWSLGWNTGLEQGLETSQRDYSTGFNAGYNQAEAELTDFYESAQSTIYNNGYNAGYGFGYTDGMSSMEEDIHEANISSYNDGYVDGYNNASSQDSTVATIFSGILQVALVPINFFLAVFNFEILGINLSGFIRALFTVAITIIIIKTIFGGKGASE